MAATHIIAIDQGTTGTTVLVVDRGGRICGRGYREVPLAYPAEAWVEQRPEDLWDSVVGALGEALKSAQVGGDQVACLGITNQRETCMVWDRASGRCLSPAVVWQCRRSAAICDALRAARHEALFTQRTGLLLDPYFSGTKLRWLLENHGPVADAAAAGTACFGTVETRLVHQLTGGREHLSDYSNASRTLMLDIQRLCWDEELLALLKVPVSMLPRLVPNAGLLARTSGLGFLPDGIPISGLAGDQQAALFGQGCHSPGDAKCTLGTGAFLLLNTGGTVPRSRHGLLGTVAWVLDGRPTYALEGSAFVAGAAVQWLRDGLGVISRSSEVETKAASVPDSGGLCFVPALTGLGAPHWRSDARGSLWGITRATTSAHLCRAVLEGITLQNRDMVKAMEEDLGRPIRVLKVDGGACANSLLMQLHADLLGVTVERPAELESTALGAAYLAGLGAGVWASLEELQEVRRVERLFAPSPAGPHLEELLLRWRRLVTLS
jgi:glycerol kinase